MIYPVDSIIRHSNNFSSRSTLRSPGLKVKRKMRLKFSRSVIEQKQSSIVGISATQNKFTSRFEHSLSRETNKSGRTDYQSGRTGIRQSGQLAFGLNDRNSNFFRIFFFCIQINTQVYNNFLTCYVRDYSR